MTNLLDDETYWQWDDRLTFRQARFAYIFWGLVGVALGFVAGFWWPTAAFYELFWGTIFALGWRYG